MNINVTLIAQMIAFALFVWFCMKFVWPPITAAMAERQKKIADGLAAADRGSKALEDARSEQDRLLREARQQAQDVLANANRQATQLVEQAKTTAQTEADRIIAGARDQLSVEVNQAREALRKQVGELSAQGAAKILKREVDAKAHADILSDLAAKV